MIKKWQMINNFNWKLNWNGEKKIINKIIIFAFLNSYNMKNIILFIVLLIIQSLFYYYIV